MNLVIDGYNLLHANRHLSGVSSAVFQRERDRLIERLSAYQKWKGWSITLVFDGAQGGWFGEERESVKGIEVIYSRRGERADDVIKRIARSRGASVVLVSSDREIERYAEKFAITVIPSEQFREKLARIGAPQENSSDLKEDAETRPKQKGPSRMLSKKEKRLRSTLRKL